MGVHFQYCSTADVNLKDYEERWGPGVSMCAVCVRIVHEKPKIKPITELNLIKNLGFILVNFILWVSEGLQCSRGACGKRRCLGGSQHHTFPVLECGLGPITVILLVTDILSMSILWWVTCSDWTWHVKIGLRIWDHFKCGCVKLIECTSWANPRKHSFYQIQHSFTIFCVAILYQYTEAKYQSLSIWFILFGPRIIK